MSQQLNLLQKQIRKLANPEKARFLAGFFRTGPGQYAAGDRLLGLTVPTQRSLAKNFSHLDLSDLQELIQSPYHEERLVSLLIATHHFEYGLKSKDLTKAENIVHFYLSNTDHINNWDLVDLSAYKILGRWCWLQNKDTKTLLRLARSKSLWEKRIAIVSTYYFIRQKVLLPTLQIASLLMTDRHDLIHKAVGWMLREVGKKDQTTLDTFLKEHCLHMPRTMLRYAIEKHPPEIRQKYLLGKTADL